MTIKAIFMPVQTDRISVPRRAWTYMTAIAISGIVLSPHAVSCETLDGTLTGRWRSTSYFSGTTNTNINIELEITSDTISVTFEGRTNRYHYKVDSSQQPNIISIFTIGTCRKPDKKISHGIYVVNKNSLKRCLVPCDYPVPTVLEPHDDSKVVFSTFDRLK